MNREVASSPLRPVHGAAIRQRHERPTMLTRMKETAREMAEIPAYVKLMTTLLAVILAVSFTTLTVMLVLVKVAPRAD